MFAEPPPAATPATFLEEKEVSSMTQKKKGWVSRRAAAIKRGVMAAVGAVKHAAVGAANAVAGKARTMWAARKAKALKAKQEKARNMCKEAGGKKDGASKSGTGGEFWPKNGPASKEFVTEMAMCFPSLRRARSWLCALGLQARAVNPHAYNPDDRTTTANKAVSFHMLLGQRSFKDMRGVSVHSGKQCSCSDTQANWFKCYKSGKRTDKSMFKDEKDIKWRDCDMCEDCHENDIGIKLPDFNPYDDDQEAKDAGAEGTLHMNPLDAWCAGGEDVRELDDTLSETIVA